MKMNTDEKEKNEKLAREYVEKVISIEQIQMIFNQSTDNTVLLICLELIEKYVINNSKCTLPKRLKNFDAELGEKINLNNEEANAAYKNNQRQYSMICQLLEFFLEYVHNYCNQMQGPNPIILPNFIFNSFANLISILFKKQLSLGDYRAKYFTILKEKFFCNVNNQNWQLVKMGLKIFNFMIDNILIDSENLGYFNYRKLINIFQHNLLFQMMNISRQTCKFLLANKLNLQQFLLVSDPESKVVVSGSQDTNLINSPKDGRRPFFSKNTIYSQIANQCKSFNLPSYP
jgi:hypothetical protein